MTESNQEQIFKAYQHRIFDIEHYSGCPEARKNPNAPIGECLCNCYEMQIFNLGREAQQKLDNRTD